MGCCHSGLSTWLCFRIENRKYKERIFNVAQFIHQTLWWYVEVAQGRTFLLAEVYKDNITVGLFRYFLGHVDFYIFTDVY